MSLASVSGPWYLGETDEFFVIAEWHPDPQVLAAKIIEMADKFDNWTEPLIRAREVMIQDTRQHFADEMGPDGQKWQQLDPDYIKSKTEAGFPDSILVRTGALKDFVTSEDAWFIDERSIYFRAFSLPRANDGFPYGAAHQEGTGFLSRTGEHPKAKRFEALTNPNRPLSEEESRFVTGYSQRGVKLPRRPFIWASQGAAESIEQIFVEHMERTIEVPWGEPISDPTSYGSNVYGTYPILGYLKTGQPMLHIGPPIGQRFGRMP